MGRLQVFSKAVFKIAALILPALLIAAPGLPGVEQAPGTGVIKAEGLNMRAGPGLDYRVLKVLPEGSRVRVVSFGSEWLRVCHGGDTGYICRRKEYVRLQSPDGPGAGGSGGVEEARRKALEVRRKIKNCREKISEYTAEEKRLASALNKTDRAINSLRIKIRDVSSEIDTLKGEIEKTREQAASLREAVASKKEYASARLCALYRIKRMGSMNLLADARSMHALVRRQAALEKIIDHDERVVADLLRKKSRLKSVLESLEKREKKKEELENEYEKSRRELEEKKAARRKMLSKVRSRKENRITALKYLKKAAARLDRALSSRKRLKGKGGSPVNSSFSEYQGLLKMPVKGKIISNYGKYIEPLSGAVNFRDGIEIRASRGAEIRAVFGGKAIYADWLKGYGNVIIISHGGEYHTVYAHADEVFVEAEDHVKADEVIGTVGDTGSLFGTALYFEIRRDGDPVNPLKWIDKTGA